MSENINILDFLNFEIVFTGMIHCGFGPSHLRNFLMECNLPPMSETTIQKIQKKIGQTIIDCAVQSCKEARQEEIDLSPEKVQVSFDAGWQKRGSGFNYNSNTGHASLIGKKTGKVLAVNIRSKVCKICDTFTVQHPNETVPYHDCSRNWSGSSTAMEVDMALNLLGEMEKEGCHVDIFHADNDSSTSGMLKSEFPNTVKMDDQNHVKKGFTKQLYELGKRYKELKQAEVIPYIQRCFVYAIQSNAGNSTKIHEDLDRIVPHIFGDHNKCRTAQWCTYNENPSSFRYKSLPGGRPLQSEDLKKELEDLVSKYKNRAENLSQLGSTQANESFNNLVATKAPKSRYSFFIWLKKFILNQRNIKIIKMKKSHNKKLCYKHLILKNDKLYYLLFYNL
ncbi:uncharacterized protein LOC134253169 [Saccostrea cucullata]|uniref:uncharacterized protein LOC134253169 n=1 Tax=Saccostrea cuccullata TaxID=36930 RepID=UPI002ED68FE8